MYQPTVTTGKGDNQVQLMRIAYSRATGVIAWIGKFSDDSSQAIAAF
jgi:hypothetical protein